MSPSAIAQFGIFAVIAVLVGFCIPALIQLRRTARAVEEVVREVSPRIGGAASSLDRVLGRVDRATDGIERGAVGLGHTLAGIGSFVGHLRPPSGTSAGAAGWIAAVSSLLTGFWQAWSAVNQGRTGAADPHRDAPTGEGGKHDG